MKKLYLLFLVMLAGVGSMWAQGSKKSIVSLGENTASGYDFITDALTVNNTSSFDATLADGSTIVIAPSASKMWGTHNNGDGNMTGTWSNDWALKEMNAVLGSNFTAADFGLNNPIAYTASGDFGSTSTLTLTLNGYSAGDDIVLYLSLASRQTSMNNISVTGLDESTIYYASNNGSGFSSTETWSSGTKAASIIKVVGKVTSNPVVFSSTTAKNGWQTISYCPWTAEAQAVEAKIAALASLDAKLAKGRLIGEGVGHYTYSGSENADQIIATAEGLLTSETATIDQINASITALDGIYNSVYFSLNMPEAGKLYRFRGYVSKKYMAPAVGTPPDTKMDMAANSELPATIFKLCEGVQVDGTTGYKLLSYNTGYYNNWTWGNGALAAAASSMSIREATSKNPGCYMLHTNYNNGTAGKWVYDSGNKVNRNGSYVAGNCDWTMEEVTWLPIPVSNTYKIGTFVSPVPLRQDDTILKFYTGEIVDDYLVLTKHEGNIPANTPFLIEYQDGAAYANGCVNLDIAASANELDAEVTNNLAGSIETLVKPEGRIYTLQPATEDATELTFRIFNGTNVAGGKAYLPSESLVKGIRYNTGETTGIEGVATEKANKEIFDLSGRRVQNPTSGLYIINGQKVYVK